MVFDGYLLYLANDIIYRLIYFRVRQISAIFAHQSQSAKILHTRHSTGFCKNKVSENKYTYGIHEGAEYTMSCASFSVSVAMYMCVVILPVCVVKSSVLDPPNHKTPPHDAFLE